MERYRSGHNGTDSKSVVPSGTVGSNPTRSAKFEVFGIPKTSFLFSIPIYSLYIRSLSRTGRRRFADFNEKDALFYKLFKFDLAISSNRR